MILWIKRNWFVLGILVALASGLMFPEVGARLNPDGVTTTLIVLALFFLIGLTLPSENILQGLMCIRLHLWVQLFVFGLAPLFFFFTSRLLAGHVDAGLIVGIIALGCLPTTVSSCTVFTQVSGGNVVGTMFNAALSNIAGVILSPLLLSLFLSTVGQGLPRDEVVKVLIGLCLKMLLPVAAGQGLRGLIKNWAVDRRKTLSSASSVLILSVVFFATARSAHHPALNGGLAPLLLPMGYLAASHLLLVGLSYGGSRLLRLKAEDRISALFAAPQKTLAMGVPLLSLYFSGNAELLGIAILPLLFYHPFQLLVAGVLKGTPLVRD